MMARQRRGKVIRNFTEKTASQTILKAQDRIHELENEIARLRTALEQCGELLATASPENAEGWDTLRATVREALGEDGSPRIAS